MPNLQSFLPLPPPPTPMNTQETYLFAAQHGQLQNHFQFPALGYSVKKREGKTKFITVVLLLGLDFHSIEQHHEQQFMSTGAFWVLCLMYRCIITEPRSCTLYAVIQWTKPSSFLSDINTIPIHHSSLRTPDEKLVQLLTPYSNSTLTEAGLTEMAHK